MSWIRMDPFYSLQRVFSTVHSFEYFPLSSNYTLLSLFFVRSVTLFVLQHSPRLDKTLVTLPVPPILPIIDLYSVVSG